MLVAGWRAAVCVQGYITTPIRAFFTNHQHPEGTPASATYYWKAGHIDGPLKPACTHHIIYACDDPSTTKGSGPNTTHGSRSNDTLDNSSNATQAMA